MDDQLPAPIIGVLDDLVPDIDATAFIAPTAVVVGEVSLGARVSIWYGAILRADGESVRIGADSNVQDGSAFHSDPGYPLVLGQRVTVGHRAVLHGCRVDDDVLIGMGAVVLNGAHIGSGSIVAAGAVVTEGADIQPGSLVAGVPAKVVKDLGDSAIERIAANAEHYVQLADRHRRMRLS